MPLVNCPQIDMGMSPEAFVPVKHVRDLDIGPLIGSLLPVMLMMGASLGG